MYNTIPKFKEWLIANCVVNLIEISLPRFFRGKRIHGLHTNFQTKNLYSYAIKNMDDYLHFQIILSFFKRSILNGIYLTNRHMFILDGHDPMSP